MRTYATRHKSSKLKKYYKIYFMEYYKKYYSQLLVFLAFLSYVPLVIY